jgi:tetratricopeptide (TPR) repeat protein
LSNNPDFMRLAEQRNLKGEWRDAIRFCERSLALDPLSPLVYEPLAWAQLRLGQYPEAEASHRKLVELSPTYSFGYIELGESLLLQGKLEQALVEVSKERNPAARLAGMAIAMTALKRKRESRGKPRADLTRRSRVAEAPLFVGFPTFRGLA